MRYIEDNGALREYLPNVLADAAKERTFFDKAYHSLADAEDWLVENLVGEDFADKVLDDPALLAQARAFVALKGIHDALPGLDMVLTPNGFGVISNQNVAPASKDRVEALRESLRKSYARRYGLLASRLQRFDEWRSTPQGGEVLSSFFRVPLDFRNDCSLEEFQDLRRKAMEIEDRFADDAVSPELMQALLHLPYVGMSPYQRHLRRLIMDYVCYAVNIGDGANAGMYHGLLHRIVDCIRIHPEDFPQWQGTSTAALWSPPVFENKKNDSGYWF